MVQNVAKQRGHCAKHNLKFEQSGAMVGIHIIIKIRALFCFFIGGQRGRGRVFSGRDHPGGRGGGAGPPGKWRGRSAATLLDPLTAPIDCFFLFINKRFLSATHLDQIYPWLIFLFFDRTC